MNRFRRVVSRAFTATADTHVLSMGNAREITGAADDNALLLDSIVVTRAAPQISNGNFEQYLLPARRAEEAPNGQPGVGWSFAGVSGISRNGSLIQGLSLSSEGVQIGYLKGQSQIQHQVTGFEPGVRYSLSWSERKSTASPAANALEIVLDAGLPTEKVVAAEHLVGSRTFEEQTSESLVADKTDYTLTLRTTNPNGGDDDTVLVDDLRFNFVADTFTLTTPVAETSTHYFRREFHYDDESDAELQLNLLSDDGAVVYLNGVEVYRENISPGPVNHATRAIQDKAKANFTGAMSLPSDALRMGRNVLAVEMHQATGSSDMAFGATLSGSVTRTGTTFAENANEWIEIYNRTDQAVDLTGWSLDDAVQFDFEDGATLAPGEFGVIARNETLFRSRILTCPRWEPSMDGWRIPTNVSCCVIHWTTQSTKFITTTKVPGLKPLMAVELPSNSLARILTTRPRNHGWPAAKEIGLGGTPMRIKRQVTSLKVRVYREPSMSSSSDCWIVVRSCWMIFV